MKIVLTITAVKPKNFTIYIVIFILICNCLNINAVTNDSIRSGFKLPVEWRIGAEISGTYVFSTNGFLGGENPLKEKVRTVLPVALKADFGFNPNSREGLLYKNLYQGIAVGMQPFISNTLLHTPVTAYVYQGMPIVALSERWSFGYEWKFGAAFGWRHYSDYAKVRKAAVSTAITAMMAVGFKFNYSLSKRWNIYFGLECQHFSNGNTSQPNAGVNTLGVTLGFAYTINPLHRETEYALDLRKLENRRKWLFDIMAYGAWRKRALSTEVESEPYVLPGKYAVAGLQFSPLHPLNRYISVGPSLDLQWDKSAGLGNSLSEAIVDGGHDIKKIPFRHQISLGLSARAELTMPIFSVNAGLGINIVNPKGDKRFYQILTVKAFLTKNLYLNVGYSLGKFKAPRSLQLGIGVRL